MNESNAEREQSAWRDALLVAALATLVIAFFFVTNFRALDQPDAMKYAQMARNFLRGEWFAQEVAYPREFANRLDGFVASRPTITSAFPQFLAPLVTAVFFAALGISDHVAAISTAFLYVLSVLFFFLTARRLLPRKEALLATTLFGLHGKIMALAVSGLAEPLFLLLVILTFYFILRASERLPFAIGVGLSLAALLFTKDLAKVFVAVALAGMPLLIQKKKIAATLLAAACLVAGYFALALCQQPTFYDRPERNIVVSRGRDDPRLVASPPTTLVGKVIERFGRGGLLLFSSAYPGHTFERSINPVRESAFYEHDAAAVISKWKTNLRVTAWNLWRNLFNPWLLLLFVAFPLVRRKYSPLLVRLYAWSMILLGAYFALCVFLFSMYRYLIAALPFAILLAAPVAVSLSERITSHRAWRTIALIALAVVCLYPFSLTAGSRTLDVISDPEASRLKYADASAMNTLGELLRRRTSRNDVVVCDVPWQAAWRGDRTSIWTPVDRESLTVLRRRAQVDWLLLTFQDAESALYWRDWLRRFAASGQETMDGFRFADGRRAGAHTFYLFRAVAPPDAPATP
jgi:hypothetical protein